VLGTVERLGVLGRRAPEREQLPRPVDGHVHGPIEACQDRAAVVHDLDRDVRQFTFRIVFADSGTARTRAEP
jgi:hypothetical protein